MSTNTKSRLARRRALSAFGLGAFGLGAFGLGAGVLLPGPASLLAAKAERRIALHNLHTGESLSEVY